MVELKHKKWSEKCLRADEGENYEEVHLEREATKWFVVSEKKDFRLNITAETKSSLRMIKFKSPPRKMA